MTQHNLSHAVLKAKQREIRSGFPEDFGLRVHRALSWYDRAEKAEDDDAKFIFLWIAFNAAYAKEIEDTTFTSERSVSRAFFGQLIDADTNDQIYNAVSNQFSGPVRSLMKNRFVFKPFWEYHSGQDGGKNWENKLASDELRFNKALANKKMEPVLSLIYDRLYMLRNQLIHGSATWDSQINRDQVKGGAAILGFLVPVFINLMMDNPDDDWGKPHYPLLPEGSNVS